MIHQTPVMIALEVFAAVVYFGVVIISALLEGVGIHRALARLFIVPFWALHDLGLFVILVIKAIGTELKELRNP